MIVITHSLGAIIFKKILEYAEQGDLRLKPFVNNLKGAILISGPNNGAVQFKVMRKVLREKFGKMLMFDSFGEVGVSKDEMTDMLLSAVRCTKTVYFVYKRNKSNLIKLQNSFDKLKLNAITISEGKRMRFGMMKLLIVVIRKKDSVMKGYPDIHIANKNHSEICMVKDETDPTLISISEFIDKSFGDLKIKESI